MDSNSIVALSVSISASTSPAETVSPSFTSQRASVPSSIVGESAGIFSSMAISIALHQHVGVQFTGVRFGRAFGEVGRFGHGGPDPLVEVLQPFLVYTHLDQI